VQNFVIFGVGLNWFVFFSWRSLQSLWNCRTSNFCWTSYFCLLLVSISVLLFSVLRSQCFKLSLINPTVILSHIAKCDLSGVEVGNWDIWQVLSKTFDCLSFNLPLVAVWIGYSYLEVILQRRYIDTEELGFFYPKFTESLSFHLSSLPILSMSGCTSIFFVVIFLCGLADRDIHQGIFEILTGNLMRVTCQCHVWWCYATGL